MIFRVAAAIHSKSHTISGSVMAGLRTETLTNILYNKVFNVFLLMIVSHVFAPLLEKLNIYGAASFNHHSKP